MATVGAWGVAESLCLLVPSLLLEQGRWSAWLGASLETTFFHQRRGRGRSTLQIQGEQNLASRCYSGIGHLCGLGLVAWSLSPSAHLDAEQD